MKTEIIEAMKIVVVTFLFTALIMPIMKKIAYHIGAVDKPRSDENHRHIHNHTVPKLGGVGIFLGFLFGYMIFGKLSIQMLSILIGSFIIILTGIVDDIKSIRASQKLIGQLIAACIIVFYGQILLNNISAFGFQLDFGIWAYPITILFIVICTNVINLIDGLDGLSSGISSIFYLTIGIIGFFQGRSGSLVMILTFIMLGATLGFLLHNFYPAKIFAGDCSMFMGFTISIISLLEFKATALTSFFVPIMIIAIPMLDTFFAIIRRLLRHQPPFAPDREHIHHQLLGMHFSHRATVLIIYAINILFAVASILYTLKDKMVGQIIYIVIFILVVWFVFHTSIISEKIPKKTGEIKKKVEFTIKNVEKKKKTTKTTKKD